MPPFPNCSISARSPSAGSLLLQPFHPSPSAAITPNHLQLPSPLATLLATCQPTLSETKPSGCQGPMMLLRTGFSITGFVNKWKSGIPIIVSALTSKAIAPQQDLVRFARRQQLPPAKDFLCMISWPPPSNAMQILNAWNSSEAYFLLENSKTYWSMMAKCASTLRWPPLFQNQKKMFLFSCNIFHFPFLCFTGCCLKES